MQLLSFTPPPGKQSWSLADLLRMPGMVARAIVELAVSRWQLLSLDIAMIERANQWAGVGRGADSALSTDAAMVAWIAFVIPRVANRLPWRADCLVQALAAQRWLRGKGVASTIAIGVDAPDGAFSAHAWLEYGEQAITGGDISSYTCLFGGGGREVARKNGGEPRS